MSSSVETRLLALLEDARRKFGDGIMTDPRRLVPVLSDDAPELRTQIGALAEALASGAPHRLARAADQPAEAAAILASLQQAGVAPAAAALAVQLAAQVGGRPLATPLVPADPVASPAAPAGAPAVPAAGGTEWVGVTQLPPQAPGAPPAPKQPTTGMQDLMNLLQVDTIKQHLQGEKGQQLLRNKWLWGGLAVLVLLYAIGRDQSPPPPPPQQQAQPQPAPPQPAPPQPQQQPVPAPVPPPVPQQQPQQQPRPAPPPVPQQQGQQQPQQQPQGGGLPMLTLPQQGTTLPVAQGDPVQDNNLVFAVLPPPGAYPTPRVIYVLTPRQGWNTGRAGAGAPESREPGSLSEFAPFGLHNANGTAYRVLIPRWQRDGLQMGEMCVVFQQPQASDVTLSGSTMCVMAAQNGNCQRVIGCVSVR